MNLVEAIAQARRRGVAPVIAEIKRLIPKLAEEGRGRDDRDAALLAGWYEEGGAAGISLVTERRHFGGQPEADVPAVLRATSLPLLIKDFILDQAGVDYYAALVAAVCPAFLSRVALLLIAHHLDDRLPDLLRYTHRRGMLALVETRGPEDLRYLAGADSAPRLVGINNKDIDELERGENVVRVNQEMISRYRRVVGEAVIVSQSAHRSPADVRRSLAAGADAVLVGTAFLLAEQPADAVASFVRAGEESGGEQDAGEKGAGEGGR